MARMLSPLLVVITCLFGATSAWPSTPRDELHRHIEELLNTVDDPSLTAEQRAVHARTTILKCSTFPTPLVEHLDLIGGDSPPSSGMRPLGSWVAS